MKQGMAGLFRTFLAFAGWFIVVCILWVGVLRFIPPPVTWAMAVQAQEQGGVQRTWKPLEAIAPSMPMAVIAAEDQGFFGHHGFEMEAIRKALDHNQRSKRKRGASKARGKHHQPADRQERIPLAGQELPAQGLGSMVHRPDRGDLGKGAHHGSVPERG